MIKKIKQVLLGLFVVVPAFFLVVTGSIMLGACRADEVITPSYNVVDTSPEMAALFPQDIVNKYVPKEILDRFPEGTVWYLTTEDNIYVNDPNQAFVIYMDKSLVDNVLSRGIVDVAVGAASAAFPQFSWLFAGVIPFFSRRFRGHMSNAGRALIPGMRAPGQNGNRSIQPIEAVKHIGRAIGMAHSSEASKKAANGFSETQPING